MHLSLPESESAKNSEVPGLDEGNDWQKDKAKAALVEARLAVFHASLTHARNGAMRLPWTDFMKFAPCS